MPRKSKAVQESEAPEWIITVELCRRQSGDDDQVSYDSVDSVIIDVENEEDARELFEDIDNLAGGDDEESSQ